MSLKKRIKLYYVIVGIIMAISVVIFRKYKLPAYIDILLTSMALILFTNIWDWFTELKKDKNNED